MVAPQFPKLRSRASFIPNIFLLKFPNTSPYTALHAPEFPNTPSGVLEYEYSMVVAESNCCSFRIPVSDYNCSCRRAKFSNTISTEHDSCHPTKGEGNPPCSQAT